MKKRFLIPTIIFIFVFLASAIGYFWWNENNSSVSDSKEVAYITIPKGKSASWIGQKLYDEGLIKSQLAFKIYVQFFGKQKNINAGQFKLSPNMSLQEVIETLQGGPLELWITIPEGKRREEIVEIFIDSLEKTEDKAVIFRQEFLDLSKDKEGFLFPDTYLFPPEATASQVINKLTQTFDNKTQDLEDSISKTDYTLNQLITMASIVERETKTDAERPIVAGILWKRLETPGWYLQADATLQYAVANLKLKTQNAKVDNWWPILTKDDLEVDSPFNSYKYKSLPPTPIANPGLSSIKAVFNPQESDYWFYIHDSQGIIHYAKTLSEHNANVRKYLGK